LIIITELDNVLNIDINSEKQHKYAIKTNAHIVMFCIECNQPFIYNFFKFKKFCSIDCKKKHTRKLNNLVYQKKSIYYKNKQKEYYNQLKNKKVKNCYGCKDYNEFKQKFNEFIINLFKQHKFLTFRLIQFEFGKYFKYEISYIKKIKWLIPNEIYKKTYQKCYESLIFEKR